MVFIKILKKHGDDSLIGDYVNNIDESRQSNNINKDDIINNRG